ncbi:hypothetical protein H6758_03260 [Candidatus Nomurabacteria bacterium]|nr:hypothetical protein [Candidatus Nomurabacteria bacterium]
MNPATDDNFLQNGAKKAKQLIKDYVTLSRQATEQEKHLIEQLEREIEEHKILKTYKKIESIDDSHIHSS